MAAGPTRMCSHCGGEMSAAGALYSALRLTFRPDDSRFMTLETGEIMTKGLMCRDCGLIEIVGDVNKLRRLTGTPSIDRR
ncbi:MAG TPA: hypothetical protein VM364_06475 [Vicinamibacterales bacterium]|nr:hypothetical protein [Vicinamibacterales bacterium]